MTIAFDYDGTISRDPKLFVAFAEACKSAGHYPVIVTMRSGMEAIPGWIAETVGRVVYTGRSPKKQACEMIGLNVDIWIDDQPFFIYQNG